MNWVGRREHESEASKSEKIEVRSCHMAFDVGVGRVQDTHIPFNSNVNHSKVLQQNSFNNFYVHPTPTRLLTSLSLFLSPSILHFTIHKVMSVVLKFSYTIIVHFQFSLPFFPSLPPSQEKKQNKSLHSFSSNFVCV